MKAIATPSSTAVSVRMRRQRERDTEPEVQLRSLLHRMGLRFRKHVKPLPAVRREADIVFPRCRVAIFVDGCYWHGCPQHATWPKSNREFWRLKIEGNRVRDAETTDLLLGAGWQVIRVWEHERPAAVAERVFLAVGDARRATASRRTHRTREAGGTPG